MTDSNSKTLFLRQVLRLNVLIPDPPPRVMNIPCQLKTEIQTHCRTWSWRKSLPSWRSRPSKTVSPLLISEIWKNLTGSVIWKSRILPVWWTRTTASNSLLRENLRLSKMTCRLTPSQTSKFKILTKNFRNAHRRSHRISVKAIPNYWMKPAWSLSRLDRIWFQLRFPKKELPWILKTC